MDVLKTYKDIEPWSCISGYPDSLKPALKEQLSTELGSNHILYGFELEAIAKRDDCDDVLFKDKNTEHIFVVHLTWNNKDVSGQYPITTQYLNFQDFAKRKKNTDHDEYQL